MTLNKICMILSICLMAEIGFAQIRPGPPRPSPTSTATPNPSPWPSPTYDPSPTPWPTSTATPTPSPWPSPTNDPSPSPYPTSTSIPSPSPYPTSTSVPYPTSTPYPTPIPVEQVRMNIQFSTETCTYNGNMAMCSTPQYGGQDFNIALNPILSSCSPNTGPDGSVGTCPSYMWQGHWIDLFNTSYGRRFIGIITVTKSLISRSSQNGPDSYWYSIEVEILGKSKTVAKMSSGFSSWDQLQTVTLLAEEEVQEGYSTKTQLRFGPSWTPAIKANSLRNHRPVQWNVVRGKLIQ